MSGVHIILSTPVYTYIHRITYNSFFYTVKKCFYCIRTTSV